jgi:hypothetical protein
MDAWEDTYGDHWYHHSHHSYWGDDWAYFAGDVMLGMAIASIPHRHEVIVVYGSTYYYSNGTYYEAKPPVDDESVPTYEVVAPPVGATVDSLPDGAAQETIEGSTYVVDSETFYKPFYSGSDVVYMVVADPTP